MKNKIYDFIIIGSGPSGYTTGIYTNNMKTITVVGSGCMSTMDVERFLNGL